LLVKAAQRNKRIVQHGTQSRSDGLITKAIELLRSGVIGDVLVAKAWNVQQRKNIGKASPSDPPIMQHCTQVYGSPSVTSARRTAGEIKLKSDTRVLSISRPVALELDHLPFETSIWQTMALKSFARKRVAIPS